VKSFERAYRAAINQVAENAVNQTGDKTEGKKFSRAASPTDTVKPHVAQSPKSSSNPASDGGLERSTSIPARRKKRKGQKKLIPTRAPYSPPKYNYPPDMRPPRAPPRQKPEPAVLLTLKGEPKLVWEPVSHSKALLEGVDWQLGRATSICKSRRPVLREIVIGIDFGTSCTKVVIGDRAMKAAYAVPFTQMAGVSTYLLPTHLGEANGVYNLSSNGSLHNDLKLAMLGDPTDAVLCSRVSAYLALAVRATRAWMFSKLKEQYMAADVVWSVAIGQPADQVTSSQSKALFAKLGKVAWYLAGCSQELNTHFCLDVWRQFDAGSIDPGDIDVLVMPELAAQIYGFVSSTEFDPKHPNIYLLVDVGAGTVDASVFRVTKGVGGTASFGFFTNAVEAHGAMNLHRYRVAWWQTQLGSSGRAEKLISDLESIRLPTEYRGVLPDTYLDYVDGVDVSFQGDAQTPDHEFFMKVRDQVAGKVLYGTYEHKLLDPESIAGMPFFLCGGGARHSFYKKLKTEMQRQPNCSWLNASYRELALPKTLHAEGVSRADYDRLSVAYGLSQLDLASMSTVAALQPRVNVRHESSWRNNYVDQSVV
jgi:hypothetical protein